MIRQGFLNAEERADLIAVARDGSAPHRLARRANAIVLVDRGMSCAETASVLFLDDDTVRSWCQRYKEAGVSWLAGFGYQGSDCRISLDQQERLKSWIFATSPRSTRLVGAWIEQQFALFIRAARVWWLCCIVWGWRIVSRKLFHTSLMWTNSKPSSTAIMAC